MNCLEIENGATDNKTIYVIRVMQFPSKVLSKFNSSCKINVENRKIYRYIFYQEVEYVLCINFMSSNQGP